MSSAFSSRHAPRSKLSFLNLPTDCILAICANLETFDDAYHLARCSRRSKDFFQLHRVSILRSIIVCGH